VLGSGVERLGDDAISLSVRDDSVGLPKTFDMQKSKGLGIKLVAALSTRPAAHAFRSTQLLRILPSLRN
jgi:two-component sensor histidine kinase